MRFSEKVLLRFCYNPTNVSEQFKEDTPDSNELGQVSNEIASLAPFISNKRIVDFGSGFGHQAIALHQNLGCEVLGLEIEKHKIEYSKNKLRTLGIDSESVEFKELPAKDDLGRFDLVLSLNSFEHFTNPDEILLQMKKLLHEQGRILISFGPPWYAPFGSHMQYFCKLPWLNLLFPEKTVMKVRKRYRADGARSYEEVPGGLAKMSIRKFEGLIKRHGLKLEKRKYHCVKGVRFLAKVPILRELFINRVSVIASVAQ